MTTNVHNEAEASGIEDVVPMCRFELAQKFGEVKTVAMLEGNLPWQACRLSGKHARRLANIWFRFHGCGGRKPKGAYNS